ncbi:MAG: DUF5615 family PIN-like protein [Chloroflexi bacterium]|nr:DUF5615 family PIN-like protein [Chloroflexota bacterium]
MADPIRFYLDEHMPRALAVALRRRGIDVVRAQDVGLRKATDLEHWQFAEQERRVLVTKDSDFLGMDQKSMSHFGIVYFEEDRRIGEMLDALTLICGAMSPGDMVNHVEHW